MRRIVIFDIDGTLLDLLQEEEDAYLKAFEVCYGITGLTDEWDSYHSHTDFEIAREILNRHFSRDCTTSELKKVFDAYALLLEREVYGYGIMPKLIPGIKDVLEVLDRQMNVGLALATGNLAKTAKLRLETAGIWRYFNCGAFAEDGKDKTLILSVALSRCHKTWHDFVITEDAIFVGDHPGDAVAAKTVGVHFIGITDRVERFNRLFNDRIHQDYSDIASFLKHLDLLWNS